VDYLDRLRSLGVEERYIELERDAWIMTAARIPHAIDAVIAKKQRYVSLFRNVVLDARDTTRGRAR
jgi:hypothetical protein